MGRPRKYANRSDQMKAYRHRKKEEIERMRAVCVAAKAWHSEYSDGVLGWVQQDLKDAVDALIASEKETE